MDRAVQRHRTHAALVVGLLALGACERPEWARHGEDPAPPTAAAEALDVSTTGLVAWAAPLIGKSPREAFPRNGVCIGNADVASPAGKSKGPAARSVIGWGWDVAAKAPVTRVILVDASYRIVGAGDGGQPRPDVQKVRPEFGGTSGWRADTNLPRGGVDAFGVVGDGTGICPLGHLTL